MNENSNPFVKHDEPQQRIYLWKALYVAQFLRERWEGFPLKSDFDKWCHALEVVYHQRLGHWNLDAPGGLILACEGWDNKKMDGLALRAFTLVAMLKKPEKFNLEEAEVICKECENLLIGWATRLGINW